MHTQVLFEHPLNEKMRTWLRIEFLIQQLTVNLPIVDHAGALHGGLASGRRGAVARPAVVGA